MSASYAPSLFEGQHAADRTDRQPMEPVGVLLNKPVELRRALAKRCNPVALCSPRTIVRILQRRHLRGAHHKLARARHRRLGTGRQRQPGSTCLQIDTQRRARTSSFTWL